MALTHFRHLLHLHRHKVTILLILFLNALGHASMAQKIVGENLPGYEFKKFRWGFSLGLNSSWYQLEHSERYVEQIKTNPDFSVNEKSGIGFNVNFITSYRLNQDFSLRAQPGVGYHSRVIEYRNTPEGSIPAAGDMIQEMNTFSGELPLLVKYESKRRKNAQLYFIAGVKPSIVVGGNKKGNPEVLQVKTFDFTIEYGVGLDMFYPYFKFAPELRYSRGISNVHEPYETVYNNSIQQLGTNTVTLYLNFE